MMGQGFQLPLQLIPEFYCERIIIIGLHLPKRDTILPTPGRIRLRKVETHEQHWPLVSSYSPRPPRYYYYLTYSSTDTTGRQVLVQTVALTRLDTG